MEGEGGRESSSGRCQPAYKLSCVLWRSLTVLVTGGEQGAGRLSNMFGLKHPSRYSTGRGTKQLRDDPHLPHYKGRNAETGVREGRASTWQPSLAHTRTEKP